MNRIYNLLHFLSSKMNPSIRNSANFQYNIFTRDAEKPLGRWSVDYCNKKLDKKIDLSNEDHCGPCGQYAIGKTNPNPEKSNKI